MLKFIKKLLRTIKIYIKIYILDNAKEEDRYKKHPKDLIIGPGDFVTLNKNEEGANSIEHFISHSKRHKQHNRRPYRNKKHNNDKTQI